MAALDFVIVAAGVDLASDGGGPVVHVLEPVRALRAMGERVVVVGLKSASGHEDEGSVFAAMSHVPGIRHLWNAVSLARITYRALKRSVTSLCYVRWGSGAWAAIAVAWWLKRKVFVEMNGLRQFVSADTPLARVKRRTLKMVEGTCLRRATVVFTTTPEMAACLARDHGLQPTSLVVNPCGANTKTLGFTSSRAIRSERGVALTLGFTGGLWRLTGFDTLLEAMAILRRRAARVRLVVAGGGPGLEEWRSVARESGLGDWVSFLGPVPHASIPRVLGGIDVGLAPYNACAELDEKGGGSPQKVFDYWACERPVILSDLPYYGYLRDSGGCVCFEAGNAAALAESILFVQAMAPQELARMGRAGRQFVEAGFTWAHNASRIKAAVSR